MDSAIGKEWHPTSKQQLWHIVSLGFHFLIIKQQQHGLKQAS